MLTVQQVADKLGLTPQGVYKKMNQQLVEELKPFIIDTKRGNRTVKKITPEGVEIISDSLEQPVESTVNEPINNDSQQLINLLEQTIEVLREQLTIKDEQLTIKDEQLLVKDRQLVAKDKQIDDLSLSRDKQLEAKDNQIERLGDMIEANQELNKNNQILIGRQQDQNALIEQKIEHSVEEKIVETQVEVKRGFLDRLFNKSKS